MIKTAQAIEQEMFDILSDLMPTIIKGSFYGSEMRPLDAKTEDAVITVSSASVEQIQEGVARVNIYTPDKNNGQSKKVPNKKRLTELAEAGQSIVDALNNASTDYLFEQGTTSNSIAVPGKNEHFVSIVINFQHQTLN